MLLIESSPDGNILKDKIKNNSGREMRGGDKIIVWHFNSVFNIFSRICLFLLPLN